MADSWQKRLLEEKEQLDRRIRALDAFFKDPEFEGLPQRHQTLLAQQFLAMTEYSAILTLRIEL